MGRDMQHPVRVEPDLGQGGGEEVAAFRRPEHRAVEPGEDAGHHQPCGGGVFLSGAGIGDLMQAAAAEAAAWQMGIDGRDAEGQNGAGGFRADAPLQLRDCLAECTKRLNMLYHSV